VKTETCESCHASVPRHHSLTVQGRLLCQPCAESLVAQTPDSVAPMDVSWNRDETICGRCEADGGDFPHGEIGGMPICQACEAYMRNWPFPGWVKAAAAVLVILGIASFFLNIRYAQAYFLARNAERDFQAGNLAAAAEQAKRARSLVPGFPQYQFEADLFEGCHLMSLSKNAESLEKFKEAERIAGTAPLLTQLIGHARAGAAFDRKDFDQFVTLSKEVHAAEPNDRTLGYQVASAYACKYAEAGDEEFRELAKQQLAVMGDPRDEEEKTYLQRIHHRLATRTIMTAEGFKTRFPDGWKPGDQ